MLALVDSQSGALPTELLRNNKNYSVFFCLFSEAKLDRRPESTWRTVVEVVVPKLLG